MLQVVRTENLKLPRMADFAQLGEAVYRSQGKQPGAFLAEYEDRRKESVHRTIEASPVGMAMLAYLEDNPQGFEGSIGRLLEVLSKYQQDKEAWPKSAKGMGDMFQRLAPALRQIGVTAAKSDRRRKHGYECKLKRTAEWNASTREEFAANKAHQVHHVHQHVLLPAGELGEHGELSPPQVHCAADMSGQSLDEVQEDV